jgi:hypothetical protein
VTAVSVTQGRFERDGYGGGANVDDFHDFRGLQGQWYRYADEALGRRVEGMRGRMRGGEVW